MKNSRSIYKGLAQSKSVQSHHVVQYAILRAIWDWQCRRIHPDAIASQATHYVRRAFTPVTRKRRLESGHDQHQALINAINRAFSSKLIKRKMEDWQTVLDAPPDTIFDTEAEFEIYKETLKALYAKYIIDIKTKFSRQYVYIFVRQDISPEYQLVQAAHVAAKMGHRQGAMTNESFDELYFTVIGVPSELALMKAEEELLTCGHTPYVFREPDLNNQITAVASSPIIMAERKGLLAYKKLTFTGSSTLERTKP